MNCRSAEVLYSSFVEDELSQKERHALESHLAECLRCSAAVDELRATVELMAALPSYEPGPHFEDDVMDRIRTGEALRPTIVEWLSEWLAPARLRPVFLTGAAACVAWIAFLIVNPAHNPMVAGRAPSPAATAGAPPSGGSDQVAMGPVSTAPALPTGSETIASAPRTERVSTRDEAARTASARTASARTASARTASARTESADSARVNGAPYQD